MRHFVKIFVVTSSFIVLSILATACGATATGPNQVHMNDSNFTQNTITIKKGEKITLVNDVATVHIIENGTWDSNGNAQAKQEPGAPKADFNIGGYSNQQLGPFNTTGTYQLYCTIHPGMALTITVQ